MTARAGDVLACKVLYFTQKIFQRKGKYETEAVKQQLIVRRRLSMRRLFFEKEVVIFHSIKQHSYSVCIKDLFTCCYKY